MRVLFWNLGYSRGHTGSLGSYLFHGHRFFYHRRKTQETILDEVARVVSNANPHIFSFAELSTGAFHNHRLDQHKYLLSALGDQHHVAYSTCKYGGSLYSRLPFFRGNTNGTVSFIEASAGHHHLRGSAKKLVVETMLPDLTILTIHLPLSKKGRRVHLQELAKTVNTHQGNIIIGGDFNLFYGTTELTDFLATTGLKAAGEPQPTFPAAKPRFHLDLFLYRFVDTTITPRVRTIDSKLSDHLPVLLEW